MTNAGTENLYLFIENWDTEGTKDRYGVIVLMIYDSTVAICKFYVHFYISYTLFSNESIICTQWDNASCQVMRISKACRLHVKGSGRLTKH